MTYQNESPSPKYDFIRYPDIVLTFFKNMGLNSELSLKDLPFKSITLMTLVTSQCVQTLSIIKPTNYILDSKCCQFPFGNMTSSSNQDIQ